MGMEYLDIPKEDGGDTREDELLLALSAHDPSAFETIVDRYEQPFLRKAESILRNKAAAQDAVQDAFTKIYVYGHKYKVQEGATFKSWAYKILLNTCLTSYQKLKKDKQYSLEFSPELESMIPDKEAMRLQEDAYDMDYLLSLLSRLPAGLARVLRLHFLEGKSQEDVAKMESVSPGALRVRIHRAKKELKKLGDNLQ